MSGTQVEGKPRKNSNQMMAMPVAQDILGYCQQVLSKWKKNERPFGVLGSELEILFLNFGMGIKAEGRKCHSYLEQCRD